MLSSPDAGRYSWRKPGGEMSISVQQMADRVAELMEARLRVKGDGLTAKLKRGGGLLPRRVIAAAEILARANEQAKIPHLQMHLDPEKNANAYDVCVRYLKPLGAGARWRARMWGMASTIAAIVLVTAVLLLSVMLWRGFI